MCALPALRLTQQHAAPEVVAASLANDISGRLTPFNGPKVHSLPNAGHRSLIGVTTLCCDCSKIISKLSPSLHP